MRSRESLVLLACHTRSHAYFSCFVAFFPTDFPAKERLLAVYSGHQNQQCLAALVGLGVSRGTMLSMERSKPADLVFRPASPHKPVSLTCCFFFFIRTSNFRVEVENFLKMFLNLHGTYTRGPPAFYHEYIVSSFKVTPLTLQ